MFSSVENLSILSTERKIEGLYKHMTQVQWLDPSCSNLLEAKKKCGEYLHQQVPSMCFHLGDLADSISGT